MSRTENKAQLYRLESTMSKYTRQSKIPFHSLKEEKINSKDTFQHLDRKNIILSKSLDL